MREEVYEGISSKESFEESCWGAAFQVWGVWEGVYEE
jgi:hypothetical protein